MDTDLALVSGIVLLVFSIPSIISVLTDGMMPRVTLLVAFAAIGLIIWAVIERPGGFSLEDVMNAFVGVAAMIIK